MAGLTFQRLEVVAYATLAVSGTAVSLADSSPALVAGRVNDKLVTRALITVETDDVRWRADGTAPEVTEGHKLLNGDSITFIDARYSQLLADIQFIKVTNNAALKITYFKLQGDYDSKSVKEG